jgi:hypothetical protein
MPWGQDYSRRWRGRDEAKNVAKESMADEYRA